MKFLRTICLVLGAVAGAWLLHTFGPLGLGALYSRLRIEFPEEAARNPFAVIPTVIFGLSAGAAILGNLSYRLIERWVINWDNLDSGEKVTIFIGLFIGVILTVPFFVLFLSQPAAVSIPLSLGLLILVTAVTIFALHSMDDILPWSKNKGKGRRRNIKILDTNVIIDGRVYDIVRTGFMDGQIYVPRFVLEELQYIADNAEPLKRQRGKRGLDILQQMQAKFPVEVGSHDRFAPDQQDGVDGRLVRLARALGADLVTNDHNLNRVAAIQDVRVVNVNELALALRPNVLPGEPLQILVSKEGTQFNQGVGYLDDGTMVVVEQGRKHVGETVLTRVTQVHQTERGKMIFAEIENGNGPQPEIQPDRPRRR